MGSRRAFTLTEMFVVLAILATLAAVVIPLTRMMRESGAAAASGEQMRALVAANWAYATDHHGHFCAADRKSVV